MRIKIKTNGRVLIVSGPEPRKRGDRFQAVFEDEIKSTVEHHPGCEFGEANGVRFISCRRVAPDLPSVPWPKSYLFLPDIHEILED